MELNTPATKKKNEPKHDLLPAHIARRKWLWFLHKPDDKPTHHAHDLPLLAEMVRPT